MEGVFRHGLANGRGTLKTKDDDKIEGDFVDHMPHGKIIMQRPNSERIEGQFRQVGSTVHPGCKVHDFDEWKLTLHAG